MTHYTGTSGPDDLLGSNGNDLFDLTQGGTDVAHGLSGDDRFLVADGLGSDEIDGGDGSDTIVLDGLSFGFLSAGSFTNIENLRFTPGHTYFLRTADGNVAPGATLTINAGQLLSA